MTVHLNIFGDVTANPDEFIYCTACGREIDSECNNEEGECCCGASLGDADNIITGAMRRKELAKVNREMVEWTELNLKVET